MSSRLIHGFTAFFAGLMLLPNSCSAQEAKPKIVKRVHRPNFSQADWDGIYFENLFEQGLVGDRPLSFTPDQLAQSTPMAAAEANRTLAPEGESKWSEVISPTTIEDEVKAIQNQLSTGITTPVRFRSDYLKAHHSFSVLSMLFAIIDQHDQTVRWKEDAGRAQVAFWRAASNSRVGTIQAYESCKARANILAELVRGGKFTSDEKAPDDLDWSNVVDRNPLMHRLQESLDRLKPMSNNKGEFTRQSAEINHETEMIAAIARVLIQENMTDGDDEGYREHANAMQNFAREAMRATKANDYEAAAAAINGISQSCDNCHGDWR